MTISLALEYSAPGEENLPFLQNSRIRVFDHQCRYEEIRRALLDAGHDRDPAGKAVREGA